MKMQGLSLDQAPPYKIPMYFYIAGTLFLIGFNIFLFIYASGIDNRYYYEAIALTHIMTIGFFANIMFGSLYQMVPVIIGESYNKVTIQSLTVLALLLLGTAAFVTGFLTLNKIFMHSASLFLGLAFITFSISSIVTVSRTVDKNETVKTFLSAFIFLLFGSIAGITAIVQHGSGFSDIRFGDIHFLSIFFGWLVMLVSGVAYKVIPMFYVTKEYPQALKKYLYIFISALIILLLFGVVNNNELITAAAKSLLAICTFIFAFSTIRLLKNRKRPRRDTTINLWYFAMANLAFASILWLASIVFGLNIDFLTGLIFGLGFAYALINGMLYKIVPFLTWFHLSSKGIFDAEMVQVIKTDKMKLQFNIFVSSYVLFIISYIFTPVLYLAITAFTVSSVMLLVNIISGYKYYQRFEK